MECRAIVFSQHAFTRMFARGISPQLVERAVHLGEVIADYPDDQPYPSVLLLFKDEKQALHVVAGMDARSQTCHIITAYWPEPSLWSEDFRTRRKK
ncbi:MAG: DUF4258 domain-containing protein [Chloroflexi bacterium]|nr:DUF4258 domain-containing protein [Chloroflexota bacterium]